MVQGAPPRVAGTDPGRQAPAPVAAPLLPAPLPRMNFTVVQGAPPRIAGTEPRRQAPVPAARALSVPPAAQALPDLLPRLEFPIDTELVYRRLTERVEEATSEKLVRRLVAREQRIEPTVLRKNLPPIIVHRAASTTSTSATSAPRYGGQPATEPMRQASFPSSGPQWQAALRRGEPSRSAAMAPPLNINQLADEVLTVIDRRLVAARERLGKR